MIGFPLALNQEQTGKVLAPAIITGSCLQILGTSPDVTVDYVGPFLLPAGDFHGPDSYISYVNAGGSWIGTAELVDFGGNVIATATVSGAGTGFIQVPFDNNVNIPSDTLCYLRFTNTDSGAGVLTWYFEVVRAGALPFIVTPPTLTWTVAHGTSPVITDAITSGTGTLVYELKRGGTTVVSGTKATLEAYVSNRATDVGPSWRVTATITNSSGSDSASSNEVAWTPAVWSGVRGLYDAASVTLVGSDVDTWQDLSGNGNDLVAASSGVRPVHSATGFNGGSQPYVEGDGVAEWLRDTAFGWGGAPTQVSFHAAMHVITPTNGRALWRYAGTGVRPALTQVTSDRTSWIAFDGTGQVSTSGSLTNARTVSVISQQSGTQKTRFAGVTDPSDRTDGADAHADGNTLGVFSAHNGTAFSHVRYAMIVFRNVATSDAERLDFQAYSAWRWGLPS